MFEGPVSTSNPFVLSSNATSYIRNLGTDLSVANTNMYLNTRDNENRFALKIVENDPNIVAGQLKTDSDARFYLDFFSSLTLSGPFAILATLKLLLNGGIEVNSTFRYI